ncbi:MAG: L-glutamate gamma-semialdehyde dehydrogenase [Sulfolobaceae archaeon]|nr:L-glutamate gamma-semialdehyde dehydrogenase [Sulfolobaceae archaeon]
MVFVNEKTYQRYVEENREEEFHREFERALERVKEDLGKEYPLLIGDKEIKVNEKFEVRSPFDRSILVGTFQKAGVNEIREAIGVAKKAFEEWQYVDWHERVELSYKTAELMRRQKFELAAIITYENGKNRFESVAEVDEAIDYFTYYAYLLEENRGYVKPMESRIYKNEIAYSVMRPYGVWAIISPFNFPLAITTTMTLGAVITGNTAVVKPSSDTPLSAFKLVEIMRRAGFPNEVVNYVTAPGEVFGKEIVENLDVAGFAFTGSRDVGHKLLKDFINKEPRPVVLELGGKNATIITAKADLNKAVEGTFRGAFGFGGQKCSATSRVFVEDKIYDKFVTMFVEKVKSTVIGDPRDRKTFLGPIINRQAVEKYRKYIEEVKKANGKILIGGNVIDDKKGYFVEPTVVVDLPYDNWLWYTELFVPIVLVGKVKSLEEAVKLANSVDYGLTAGIFSEDKTEIEYFFDHIQAGVTYANRVVGSTTGAMPGVQPFGGWKHSGWTGRNAGGPYYLLSFLREQARTEYV